VFIRFGDAVQTEAAILINDTAIECKTTWGPTGPAQTVAIALNGKSFYDAGGSVLYSFFGFHR